MKRLFVNKKFIMFYCTILLLVMALNIFNIANNNMSYNVSGKEDTSAAICCSMEAEGNYVRPILDEKYIGENNKFKIYFETSLSDFVIADYWTEGLEIVKYTVNKEIIAFIVLYNGNSEEIRLSLSLSDNHGDCLTSSIFGVNDGYGLLLNDTSFDSAWSEYYTILYNNDVVTEEEYAEIIDDIYHNIGDVEIITENTYSGIIPYGPTKTISGSLKWEDDDGTRRPLRYIKVCLYDTIGNEFIKTTYTSETGEYNFLLPVTKIQAVKVYVYAASNYIEVRNSSGQPYYFAGKELDLLLNDNYTMNWIVNMSAETGQAFQIAQAAAFASNYYKEIFHEPPTNLDIVYPNTGSNSCYYSSDTIYLRDANLARDGLCSYNSWDVIMHEYGHHVQKMQNHVFSSWVTGSHNFVDALKNNLDNNGNEYGKDKGCKLAWSESVATIFSELAQEYYSFPLGSIDYVCDNRYDSYNGANLDYETSMTDLSNTAIKNGESCEATIIGILWDLCDKNNSESHDDIYLKDEEFFELLVDSQAKMLGQFTAYFLSACDTDDVNALGTLLEYYNLAPQNIHVTNNVFSWEAGAENDKFCLRLYDIDNNLIYSSSIINGSVPNLNQYVAQGDIFVRIFGYDEEEPETSYFSSGLSSESTSSLPYSEPEYLQFKIISRSGFLFYNWEIEIINPNPYDVVVTYNTKMCFGDDAKNFTNLVDLTTTTICANSSKKDTINANVFAGWITASIDYTYWSNDYRKITCADGLSGNLTMNTPTHNKIFRN